MVKYYVKSLLIMVCFSWMLVGCKGNKGDGRSMLPVDYSMSENWLKVDKEVEHEMDVFYLYPTVWIPKIRDGVFCELDNESMRKNAPKTYEKQAKVFEEVANVYVPWYRQLDATKTLGRSSEEVDSMLMEIPYKDALAAFEYFLEHYNQGRPFVLAGHSQGSSVIRLLLQEYMREHPEVLKRMVAAYVPGYSFEKAYFEKNPHLKFAEGETDTGVVISWNCERKEDGEFGTRNVVCYPGALSVNPVSWKHDYELVAEDDERQMRQSVMPDLVCSAQVEYDAKRGYEVLILGVESDEYDIQLIGDQSLHTLDFTLFGENIKVNAVKRCKAWMEAVKE